MMNVESTKDKRVWHSGPPPFIGWWNASATKTENLWRWWNGDWWSIVVFADASPERASKYAVFRDANTARIEWNDYWPEDAVCPRLNPGQSSTIWKGKVWAWVDGELVNLTDKFVNTKALEDELQNISVELADIEAKVANIVHCIGRVRKVLRGE